MLQSAQVSKLEAVRLLPAGFGKWNGCVCVQFVCITYQVAVSQVWPRLLACVMTRGVVVPERGRVPFRQIFLSLSLVLQ